MRARYPRSRQRNGEYYFIALRADKQGVPLKQLSSWLQRHKKKTWKKKINKHLLHQVVFFCCLPDAQQTRQFETRGCETFSKSLEIEGKKTADPLLLTGRNLQLFKVDEMIV